VPSVFTRIIDGELPATFVWRDERCVAFLSIKPLRAGHVLVVPKVEVEHWIDLDPQEWAHAAEIARRIGQALQRAYSPAKVGSVIVGLEVPHVHIHLVPIDKVSDLDFAEAGPNADPEDLEREAERIRAALAELGMMPEKY
jgi:histidine triad (HIT) family protein